MPAAPNECTNLKNCLRQNEKPCLDMKSNQFFKETSDLCADQSSVSSFTVYPETYRINSDIRNIISNKLNGKLYDIVQALKNFDQQRNGKILPLNLYNVLNIFCHPLTLKEFNELLKKEKLDKNGFICYKSFLSKLTNKQKELNDACQNKKNKINLSYQNTEEIEMKVKQKVGRNIKNFIRSMRLYDYNHDGLIQKQEFRTVLENYCFPLSDDQFNKLWSLYDPNSRGIINCKDFLLKLGTRSEAYKRIMPKESQAEVNEFSPSNVCNSRKEQIEKRYAKLGRDDPAVQGQDFTKVIETFKRRVEKSFPVLLRTFQIKDGGESGYIPLSVFHQVLNYFVMPMSVQLFKQVLMSFKVSPTATKIKWYEFLKDVCIKEDTESVRDISYISGSHSWHVCKSLMEKLRKSGNNIEDFFKNSFIIPTRDNKKTITRAELRRTINQFLTFPVTEEEFRALMFMLDPGHTNVIQCQRFLSMLVIPRSESNKTSKEQSNEDTHSGNATYLSGEKLLKDFKKSFNMNFRNIEKTINAFDSEETGFMHIDEFKKVLDNFCFPLTDVQFLEILKSFSTTSNKVFYSDFIKHYKKGPYEDEEKWALCVKKLTTAQDASRKLENNEILRHVKDAVKAHKEQFLEEFKNHDYCNAGIARKEVFSKLIDKYVFRLNEEQLNMLWNTLPVNEIGLLKYEEYLNRFKNDCNIHCGFDRESITSSHCSSQFQSPSTKKSLHSSTSSIITKEKDRPKTASSVATSKSARSSKSSLRPKSAVAKHSWDTQSFLQDESRTNTSVTNLVLQGQGCSVLTNQQYKQYRSLNFGQNKSHSKASNNCTVVKEKFNALHGQGYSKENYTVNPRCTEKHKKLFVEQVKSRWRDILRRCKAQDSDNFNSIPWDEFISILHNTGVSINDEVLSLLQIEYNIQNGQPVNYWTLFKKIHLALDSCNSRKILYNNEMEQRPNSIGLYKVLITIRDKVLKNNRDLRHAFRRADYQHCGCIRASDFRRILVLHKIVLTEDDFFYICDYFDPKLTELIHYDKFLEAFIKG